jgi:serine/threonine-protein kinase PpkA
MRTQPIIVRSVLALVILVTAAFVSEAQAQSSRPLTLEGKTALYQRVIAVPGARLSATMGPSNTATLVTPFTVFYVYRRDSKDGRDWLQVGTNSSGGIDGWLAADQGIDWEQALTVGFRDPEKHPRVLLFEDRESLNTLINENNVNRFAELRTQAEQGIEAGSPVAAIQPEGYIDIRRNFYLVPILSHEDVLVGPQQGRLLRVATVPLQDPTGLDNPYRAGIVFVIDTTISMGPYIERMRSIMRRVNKAIAAANLSDKVSYGLVAYRDSLKAVPELEYATRIYAPLESGGSGSEFLDRIKEVHQAQVSSEGYNEDAYAGIRQAITEIDWSGFYARYVILITDAGPRLSDDPLSATGLDTESLRRLAQDNDIVINVIHLRSPSGADNHAYAEEQYRQLSTVSGIGELYQPVEAGDVSGYEKALSGFTTQLTDQVREAASGRAPLSVAHSTADHDAEPASYQQKVERLGYALRMRYLQEEAGQGVPALFNAWMVDRDLTDPGERAVDIRVMLTRDQLSDLHEVLKRVLEAAEEGALAPQDFLQELISLSATISRDPEAVKSATRTVGTKSLADLGYMREYLEGLPYKSQVMDLDLSTWQQWSAQQQFEFINQLDSKVAYYRALHDNVDLWVSLDGGPIDGDSLYPLLLEALP